MHRLIPAHAGKTGYSSAWRVVRAAHPRSRGENSACRSELFASCGSSPLTRGKRKKPGRERITDRLIPAHAGKTVCSNDCTGPAQAHPRSRGENYNMHIVRYPRAGSSPLTRGKHVTRAQRHATARLIPAHAGKTGATTARTSTTRAHPRSRGENLRARSARARVAGSSPLTRGKPRGRSHRSPSRRLIPAHAGKTMKPEKQIIHRQAHPRSRGENAGTSRMPSSSAGSSPLTRGKLYILTL